MVPSSTTDTLSHLTHLTAAAVLYTASFQPDISCAMHTVGRFAARQVLRARQATSPGPPGRFSGPARQVLWARQAGSLGPPGRFSGLARQVLRARQATSLGRHSYFWDVKTCFSALNMSKNKNWFRSLDYMRYDTTSVNFCESGAPSL